MNIIEEFKFKVSITIDNQMDGVDGTPSVVQTQEIGLTVSCSPQSPQMISSIPEIPDGEISLGGEAEFMFSSFTCSPEDCCRVTYGTRSYNED